MKLLSELQEAVTNLDILLPPKEYIKNILHAICDHLGYCFGSVIEIDTQGKGYMIASYNLPEDYPERVHRVNAPVLSSPSGEAIETGRIVVANDAISEPRLAPWSGLLQAYNLKTIVWVPIKSKGQAFGTYNLYDTKNRDVLKEELQTLEQIAVIVSIAIASNQYLDQLNQRTKELQQENEKRQQVEKELRRYQTHLKELVAERTKELQDANSQLQEKIIERKWTEKELEKYRHRLEHLVEERTTELSRANAELIRSARLKDEFLAMMSHELRTPLNVVLGMSEALLEEVYGPLNEQQFKFLRLIGENGHRLLEIITDILELSAINSGKIPLDIGPVAPKLLCQQGLHLVKQPAQQKELTISFTFDDAVMTIYADGRRLKRVLVSLLENAVKFTSAGGEIGLNVEGEPEDRMVCFTVWDTGIGIAPETIEQVFQPFIQLDSGLCRQYKGIGLGLALVYRIVDMHGGSISVESESGKGSRFTVSLPWKEPDGSALRGARCEVRGKPLQPLQPATHSPQPATILIAEDNEANIEILSDYLKAHGYRIITARNGEEAITRAREEAPGLIVMDLHMPGVGGLEAIRRIRADEKLKTVPIIAVTALMISEGRERCLAAGADAYMSKPVKLRKLSEKLEKLLGR